MSSVFTLIVSLAILIAIIGGGAFALWFFLGRKKKGEDKMVGTLEQSAVFKGGSATGGPFRNGVR